MHVWIKKSRSDDRGGSRLALWLRAVAQERQALLGERHAQSEIHISEELLDLEEGPAAEVPDLDQFRLVVQADLPDVLDAGVLQAVGCAYPQLKSVHAAPQGVQMGQNELFRFRLGLGHGGRAFLA